MVRAKRTDACRNRERLLEVASTAFGDCGVHASLEKIAKVAGVGIGTLYRHFPTRDALAEAVYRRDVESLCAGAVELSATLPPDQALSEWLTRFVCGVARKKGLATYLTAAITSGSDLFTSTCAQVEQTVDTLVCAAAAAGLIRPDVNGMDLIRALSGVCLMAERCGGADDATKVAELLMDGLRYGAPADAGTPPSRVRPP